ITPRECGRSWRSVRRVFGAPDPDSWAGERAPVLAEQVDTRRIESHIDRLGFREPHRALDARHEANVPLETEVRERLVAEELEMLDGGLHGAGGGSARDDDCLRSDAGGDRSGMEPVGWDIGGRDR